MSLAQTNFEREYTALKRRVPQAAREFAKVFKLFNWTWRGDKTPPTSEEIAATLHRLLDNVKKGAAENGYNPPYSSSTGRLFADFSLETKSTAVLKIGVEVEAYEYIDFLQN